MSCCRPKRKPQRGQNDPAPCKILEQGGASTKFWVMNSHGAYGIYMRDASGKLIEVNSFFAAYQCSGSAASMLMRSISRVVKAANQNPGAFRQQGTSGISLVKLLRTADTVLGAGSSHGRRVHPFSSR